MQEFCMRGIALSDYARCGEGECCVAVAVTEGKFHQIKRMFEALAVREMDEHIDELEEENKKLKYVIDLVMEKAGIEYIRLAD